MFNLLIYLNVIYLLYQKVIKSIDDSTPLIFLSNPRRDFLIVFWRIYPRLPSGICCLGEKDTRHILIGLGLNRQKKRPKKYKSIFSAKI